MFTAGFIVIVNDKFMLINIRINLYEQYISELLAILKKRRASIV